MRQMILEANRTGDWSAIPVDQIPQSKLGQLVLSIPVTTTEIVPGMEIVKSVDIVTAECAIGLNIISDFFAAVTDVVGGRSSFTQNALKEGRKKTMIELRSEAFAIGANAIIGVDIKFSEFSGGGKSMLLIVASGTAVVAKKVATKDH